MAASPPIVGWDLVACDQLRASFIFAESRNRMKDMFIQYVFQFFVRGVERQLDWGGRANGPYRDREPQFTSLSAGFLSLARLHLPT